MAFIFNPFTGSLDIVDESGAPPSLNAGEALNLGDLLTIDASGNAVRATATFSSDLWRLSFVALESVGIGNPVTLGTSGKLVPILFSSAPAAGLNGSPVFLSNTSGQATLTPPTSSGEVVYSVGVLQGADGVTTTPQVLFHPQYISRRP